MTKRTMPDRTISETLDAMLEVMIRMESRIESIAVTVVRRQTATDKINEAYRESIRKGIIARSDVETQSPALAPKAKRNIRDEKLMEAIRPGVIAKSDCTPSASKRKEGKKSS